MKADSKQVTDALVDMAGSAIERARSESSPDLLLADEEFLERLADRVVEKLDAREAARLANLDKECQERLKLLAEPQSAVEHQAMAHAGPWKLRWGMAVAKAAGSPEPCPRSGQSRPGPQ